MIETRTRLGNVRYCNRCGDPIRGAGHRVTRRGRPTQHLCDRCADEALTRLDYLRYRGYRGE